MLQINNLGINIKEFREKQQFTSKKVERIKTKAEINETGNIIGLEKSKFGCL